ncbi:hypothetical protein TNCV_32741 [Trichonephila clavipes]|nr:hypothetical protein TNCV_32741 [Trichonephila clavipes]
MACSYLYEVQYESSVSVINGHVQTGFPEEVVYHQVVGRWCCIFNEKKKPDCQGWSRSGRNFTSTNENNILRIRYIILQDRRMTVSEWYAYYTCYGPTHYP